MNTTEKGIDWTDLRPINNFEDSPAFEEFRKEAEKAVTLVWQLNPDEKVEALFLWNRLATKLKEIIAKATDEMMNDIVELTSGTNIIQKELSQDEQLIHLSSHTNSSLDLERDISVAICTSESERFTESFTTSHIDSTSAVAEIPPKTSPEYLPNIFSPVSQAENDLKLETCGKRYSKSENSLSNDQGLATMAQDKDKEKSWTCHICSEKASDEKLLAEHISTFHSIQKRYKCKECACSFTTRGNLNVHIRKHSGERPFACPKCPIRFTSGGNLRRHLLSHQGLKPYVCDLCEIRFTEKKSLLIHQRSHSGEKPYICPQCHKGFAQSSILRSHLSVHSTEKPYLCQQCGKVFKQKQQLDAHEMRHRGTKIHSCDCCEASFVTKGDLTRHRKSHLGVKPFQCEQCKKSFMRRENYKEHMYRHLGIKPLKCTHCDTAFDDLSSYHKHVKQH